MAASAGLPEQSASRARRAAMPGTPTAASPPAPPPLSSAAAQRRKGCSPGTSSRHRCGARFSPQKSASSAQKCATACQQPQPTPRPAAGCCYAQKNQCFALLNWVAFALLGYTRCFALLCFAGFDFLTLSLLHGLLTPEGAPNTRSECDTLCWVTWPTHPAGGAHNLAEKNQCQIFCP